MSRTLSTFCLTTLTSWRETFWLQQFSQIHLQLHIDAIAAWEMSWYTPLSGLRQRYQERSHVDISAFALGCPTSMYVDPRAQQLSVNALVANQRMVCTAFRAVDVPSNTLKTPFVIYANDAANIFGASKTTLVVYWSQSTPEHSLSDIAVRGLRECRGASFRRKQWGMELLRLCTLLPEGLNNVFHFQWRRARLVSACLVSARYSVSNEQSREPNIGFILKKGYARNVCDFKFTSWHRHNSYLLFSFERV